MRVAIAGRFDPIHDGHIDHILKAKELGDELVIITHSDQVIRDVKGKCNVPLWARCAVLRGLLLLYKINGYVTVSTDVDGTVAETLRALKPQVFAKGGDRVLGTLPENELKVCEEIGCEIRYGIGDLLNASSKISIDKEG